VNLLLRLVTIIMIVLPITVSAENKPLSPETIEGIITVDVIEAKKLFDLGVIFIDVRKDKDWNAGRVPDAEHFELSSKFTKENLEHIFTNLEEPMVIYCNGPKCLKSSKASIMALEWGYKKIYYFRAGFPAWKKANNPIE
jgi:rhodanese-related sulfurtransferase